MSPARIARSLYALRACDEFIPWFALYAIYMIESGLSPGELSVLFVIWSVTAFVLEVPSGAWADTFSRRKLIALGSALRAAGFLLWTVWPTFWGFALGFVLWGVRSAMKSGAVEALVYDELAALGGAGRAAPERGQTQSYLRIIGRGQTIAIVAMMLAVGLGTPVYLLGGYQLAGWLSVAMALAGSVAALSFPETPRVRHLDRSGFSEYLHQLQAGVGEARRNVKVRHALVLAIGIGGLTAFDEFIPLLVKEMGASVKAVPLLLLIPAAAMAGAAAIASRFATVSARRAAWLIAVAAALLAVGPLTGRPIVAMLLLAVTFAVCQLMRLLTEARLQSVIEGAARATVLSVGGLGAELVAVSVYFGYGLGSTWLGAATLVALFAAPLFAMAIITFRWLPPARAMISAPPRTMIPTP